MLKKVEEKIWKQPLYPEFSRSEYDDRIERAKRYMTDEKLDILVLWDVNNIRYFSGFRSVHWAPMTLQCAVLLIPVDKEPVIVVPDFFQGVVEGFTFLNQIRLLGEPHVTAHMRELPKLVADTVKELGSGKGRIGIEGGLAGGMCWPRPINDIDLFRAELDGADFVYAADVIWKCRTIKSPAEIDALWIATEADVRAYGELVANFELGWTERDVGRFIRNKVLEFAEDCPPPLTLASSRRVCMADVPAFDDEVSLSTGDRLALEPYALYKGYWGSCARSFHIGPIPEEALQKSMAIDRSVDVAKEAVKPGITSGRILEIINEALAEKGYENSLDMGGHGVGLNFQEPPAIATGEEFVVEEGMVLAIEAWALDADDMSARKVPNLYGIEDYVVVTKDGSDPFPTFSKDIRCLGV